MKYLIAALLGAFVAISAVVLFVILDEMMIRSAAGLGDS